MDELWCDDFEVLHWVVERFERHGNSIELGEAVRAFPEDQYDSVRQSLRRVSAHTYVLAFNGDRLGRGVARPSPMVNNGTGRILHAVGGWPDNAELLADRILAVLAEGAENEPDPGKRSKLKAGLKGFGEMTREVLVGVVAAAIARSTSAA